MKKTSQADRVLKVLKDGAWHDIAEIHWHAGQMRLNSRVADLRRRGLHIEHSIRKGRHGYQLFKGDSLPRDPWPVERGGTPAAAGDGVAAPPSSLSAPGTTALSSLGSAEERVGAFPSAPERAQLSMDLRQQEAA